MESESVLLGWLYSQQFQRFLPISTIALQTQQVTMFLFKDTNAVRDLAPISYVLCSTSNASVHHISFDSPGIPTSMIKELFLELHMCYNLTCADVM